MATHPGTRGTSLPNETVLQAFASRLRGKLIRLGDDGYEAARKVYNAMIDRRPLGVVRCADVADVIHTVTFAREHNLTVAVRGGGHSVAGFGTCDDGLVIDLGGMRGIRVDPGRRTVCADGGCTWGDVDHATHPFGLATPGGLISTTGIGGLTLGGGIGHLTRCYGLSCDNLISADVVTADGQVLTASATERPDLFWALRGGGGNFGVVTSFEFKLHPVSTVYAGPVLYPLERAAEAMRFYREFMDTAPRELNAFFAFLIVPPGPPFPAPLHMKTLCGVVCTYCGDLAKAEAATEPLREFGPAAFAYLGPAPFPAVQSMFDALLPPGQYQYWKGDFVNELSDDLIAVHLNHGPRVPTVQTAVHIYPVSGAVHDVGKHETAFAFRGAKYAHIIAAVSPDPGPMSKYRDWVRDYWSALHPFSSGGAYVNFMMEEGEERIAASYGENYPRLGQVKKQYDPQNLFHVNQNIKPAA